MSCLSAAGLRVDHGPRRILDIETLTLRPGEVTAVIGPNGAGKSTLLQALAGLAPPRAGVIALGEHSLLRLDPKNRARRIGFLPQIAEVAWPLEVRTLVGLGLIPFGVQDASASDGRIDHALREMGVAALAARRFDTLSGGERARVLLARAIVGDPEWLIADEPLAGLDPAHVIEACDALARRAKEAGRGVVITLHDLTVASRIADRIILLSEGRIVADGAASQALTPEALRGVYGIEAVILSGDGGGLIDIVGRSRPEP